MFQPEDIRRKAENLYCDFLRAWLDGDSSFFPRAIRGDKTLPTGEHAAAIDAVNKLRGGSKEVHGFGYTIEWREVNSRTFGRNRFPARVLFETQGDYLRFIGRQRDFAVFADAAARLRAVFPELQGWMATNVHQLTDVAPDLDGLLHVLLFFREHPRPGRFARELPIPVDTKFIERNRKLLREWLDLVLPPNTIRADESHFERRYGLRYAEPHLLVRLLDPDLQRELGVPCAELSLPLHALAELAVRDAAVVIVENKVNLLTLPLLPRVIGLGALGDGVVLLRYVPWLVNTPITYWGDVDVEGFEILSSLRTLFPATRSYLMDDTTLDRWSALTGPGTGRKPVSPPGLDEGETAAFRRCRDENLRLEQERLLHHDVMSMLGQLRH